MLCLNGRIPIAILPVAMAKVFTFILDSSLYLKLFTETTRNYLWLSEEYPVSENFYPPLVLPLVQTISVPCWRRQVATEWSCFCSVSSLCSQHRVREICTCSSLPTTLWGVLPVFSVSEVNPFPWPSSHKCSDFFSCSSLPSLFALLQPLWPPYFSLDISSTWGTWLKLASTYHLGKLLTHLPPSTVWFSVNFSLKSCFVLH